MSNYRTQSIYISPETRFYAGLRAKQFVKGTEASVTLDQVIDCDLRNLWTNDNPSWVLAWEKRETLRQKHKKDLERIENEAVGLVPELEVNNVK